MQLSKAMKPLAVLSGLVVTMCILVLSTSCEQAPMNHEAGTPTKAGHQELPQETIVRKVPVLGFSQLGSESAWRLANTSSIMESAAESDVKIMMENAEQSQDKQFEAIREFVKQKVDVIAVAPVVETGWEPVLREVEKAGIPVVIIDRYVDVSDTSLYVTHIGSDFYEEGRKAGKYLLDKFSDQREPIGIVELKGTEGSTPSIARGKGFRDVIANHSQFRIIESDHADFTTDKGKEVMKKFLHERKGQIRVLFSHNDDMTLGAIEAIEQLGLVPGKDIVIVTVDGTRRALEKLSEGKINLVVECNPLLGPNLIQAVKEIVKGNTIPKRIVTTENVFTQVTAAGEIVNRSY
ncbi:ABC transporter substrate-binding protein [Paenibacillus chartarius]|uniref:ABC transporter substrate-binding protein n=1 Tax=Paenibacillus chartarius TaxID=747481 RepID=A0ABV6DHL1_9BACL